MVLIGMNMVPSSRNHDAYTMTVCMVNTPGVERTNHINLYTHIYWIWGERCKNIALSELSNLYLDWLRRVELHITKINKVSELIKVDLLILNLVAINDHLLVTWPATY